MENLEPKTVSQSAINDYFHILFPNDLSPLGLAFGGRVIEIADRVAGTVAARHSGLLHVTLLIDSIKFFNPAKEGEALIFKAAVNRVWKTSLEVGVKVFAQNLQTGDGRHVASAYFTFVAIDKNLQPIVIRPVTPETENEKRRYQEAEERRRYRLSFEKELKNKPR